MKTLLGCVCAIAAALTSSSLVWAEQPHPVGVTIESRLVRWGSSSLRLTNLTREAHSITIMPGPQGTVDFRAQRVDVAPGAPVDVVLGQLSLADGVQVFQAVSLVNNEMGADRGPTLHEVIEVSSTDIRKTTYEQAFLSKRIVMKGESQPGRYDIGGGYVDVQPMAQLAFASQKESADVVIEPVDEVDTYELSNMRRKELPEVGGAVGGDAPLRAMAQELEERGDFLRSGRLLSADGNERSAGLSGIIKGKFMVKIPGPSNTVVYQAAWGWKVRAWQLVVNTWFQVGSTSVKSDGKWSIDLAASTLVGLPVRIEYQPANRFVQIQDANAHVFTWGDNWNLTPSVTDIGYRSADLTKTGAAPGIDIIFQGATAVWRKFKNNGMNALRDEPIQVTYPNTVFTGKCLSTDDNGMPIAWSCSQGADGKIWLIQAHASADVIQHEIGHSIHNYYWDGNMPVGGGIKHNGTKCYNPGLALTEGFATFVSYWTQFSPNAVNPKESYSGWNLESLGSGFCASSSNEAMVAATFWDMYDTTSDGSGVIKDSWNFVKAGAPVAIFLNNPGHNSMLDYATVVTTILGPNWATPVMSLFWMNNMFVP